MSVRYDTLKYGYTTDVNNKYAVIGSPSSFFLDSSYKGTGSVIVYKYDNTSDQYLFHTKLVKSHQSYVNDISLLIDSSSLETILNADSSSIPTDGLFIEIDADTKNFVQYDNGYGREVSISSSIVVVGCPYNYYSGTETSDIIQRSGSIDIYNLNNVLDTDTQILPDYIIENDDILDSNNTFGESVAISNKTLVVGSSGYNNYRGIVNIYTQSLSNSWLLYQSITGSHDGMCYGYTVKIDRSGSNIIAVGNNSTSSSDSFVDIYAYDSTDAIWKKSDIIYERRELTGSLTFIESPPYIVNTNSSSKFGSSVSIDGNNIIIGAPHDMYYYEYSGSNTIRNRGATYFYYKCANESGWKFLNKSYGDEKLLKTNNFGHKVDVNGKYAIASNIKPLTSFSSSYISNTVNKIFDCNINNDFIDTLGQYCLYENINTAVDAFPTWSLLHTITKKKETGYPYTSYGTDISIQEDRIIVGSPLTLVDPLNMTSSFESIKGYSYIYNLNDLQHNPRVGNVFYRNGKIILSNSGSVFGKLLRDKNDQKLSKYDINYKSQITLYEKQIVCRINPGEFNVSTNPSAIKTTSFEMDIDKNNDFDFVDVDLIFRFICDKINGNQRWYNYFSFTEAEYSIFSYYYDKYELWNISGYKYINNYIDKLNEMYLSFDVDGNLKIDFSDMYLIWKYFIKNLTVDDVFKYIDFKSRRKNITDIVNYLDDVTGKKNKGAIKDEFAAYSYSSSLDKTGSYLAPYITSIGLYSGTELVAISKLGMPVKNTGDLPLNILVKWDI